jgi:hypothetical protein
MDSKTNAFYVVVLYVVKSPVGNLWVLEKVFFIIPQAILY